MSCEERFPSSFRDPAGFIFRSNGRLFRRINQAGAADYDLLMSSGLYDELVKDRLLISHEEIPSIPSFDNNSYKTILPQQLDFISYPYEWCFGQLQAAALLTLEIQRRALARKMILKDSSAFNIQWLDGQPILIDTLSFEAYEENTPWQAYRQFCQHFLGPLALISLVDQRLGGLWRNFLDGVPIDLAARLLPLTSMIKPGLLVHIHLHARSQRKHTKGQREKSSLTAERFSKTALLGLIDSLSSAVAALSWPSSGSAWDGYYQNHSYSEAGFRAKEAMVEEFLTRARPRRLWDLGANTGVFSKIAVRCGVSEVVAWDYDINCVQRHFDEICSVDEHKIIPLLLDLTNPSPSLGWNHQERMSLVDRSPVEAVLALALIHHLAIGNNIPLPELARFFYALCGRCLIIEFVPKNDPMVQHLLATRKDIFANYTREEFEAEFCKYFVILEQRPIPDTSRYLYLMGSKEAV